MKKMGDQMSTAKRCKMLKHPYRTANKMKRRINRTDGGGAAKAGGEDSDDLMAMFGRKKPAGGAAGARGGGASRTGS